MFRQFHFEFSLIHSSPQIQINSNHSALYPYDNNNNGSNTTLLITSHYNTIYDGYIFFSFSLFLLTVVLYTNVYHLLTPLALSFLLWTSFIFIVYIKMCLWLIHDPFRSSYYTSSLSSLFVSFFCCFM